MSDFDIENFPTSEAAKRMMGTISEEFYRDSYVMKWLQQVMGIEWDDAARIIGEELPKQFFPETATWGLRYHEIKWQLPVRENLSYEERRKRIYQKRDFKAPMTPYKMEEYLQKITEAEVHILDCHDPGGFDFVPEHPNQFKAVFIKDGTLDSKTVIQELKRIKQSHTVYCTIEDRVIKVIDCRNIETMDVQKTGTKISVSFWSCHIFDGTDYFDGSLAMNSERRYDLILGLKYDQGEVNTQESIENATVIKTRNPCFFDGSVNFDGSRIMNSIYQKEVL
ncbi:MAG: YmfQ family protein [Roseburia sp.]|nr:YmfQ family protein [Roseburia sp.]